MRRRSLWWLLNVVALVALGMIAGGPSFAKSILYKRQIYEVVDVETLRNLLNNKQIHEGDKFACFCDIEYYNGTMAIHDANKYTWDIFFNRLSFVATAEKGLLSDEFNKMQSDHGCSRQVNCNALLLLKSPQVAKVVNGQIVFDKNGQPAHSDEANPGNFIVVDMVFLGKENHFVGFERDFMRWCSAFHCY